MGKDARAIATEFLDAVGAGSAERALALFTPGATAELTPLQLRGAAIDVVGRYLADLAGAFPELHLTTRRLFVGRDGTAVAEVTIRGAQVADLWGIRARGRALDLDQAWLLRVDGSMKIDRIGAYWCQYQLCRMLGERRLDHLAVGGSP